MADLIALKMISCYIRSYNFKTALDVFTQHQQRFRVDISTLKAKLKFRELKWRYKWSEEFAKQLETLYKARPSLMQ